MMTNKNKKYKFYAVIEYLAIDQIGKSMTTHKMSIMRTASHMQ